MIGRDLVRKKWTYLNDRQEMAKGRPRVTSKLKEWQDWLISHVPKPIKGKASRALKTFKGKVGVV